MKMITRRHFNLAMTKYWRYVNQLPVDQQALMPNFEDFVPSQSWSPQFNTSTNQWNDYIELTDEGAQRYEMLQSPHAQTLLSIYAIQRLQTLEASHL